MTRQLLTAAAGLLLGLTLAVATITAAALALAFALGTWPHPSQWLHALGPLLAAALLAVRPPQEAER